MGALARSARFAGLSEPGYSKNGLVGKWSILYELPMQRRHLKRLDRVWVRDPVFFVTTCTHGRKRVLDHAEAHGILLEVWEKGCELHGWSVGEYVIMPDHVHFFCRPRPESRPLEFFVGKWKEWSAKFLQRRAGLAMPLWQEEFFDHVLRSRESYSFKWEYVRENPVRAGLVIRWEDWPYRGALCDLGMNDVEKL